MSSNQRNYTNCKIDCKPQNLHVSFIPNNSVIWSFPSVPSQISSSMEGNGRWFIQSNILNSVISKFLRKPSRVLVLALLPKEGFLRMLPWIAHCEKRYRWLDVACFPIIFSSILASEDKEADIFFWKRVKIRPSTMAGNKMKEALIPLKYMWPWQELGTSSN